MGLFNLIAVPLGWVMRWIYRLIPDYFAALFIFTLLFRLLMFPLSLKSQKNQADRARLQPRLERLQKKYSQDRQKLQQKQTELYEKEGVSMTGGCLPTLVQMLLLFGVIAVIYQPLTYLHQVPATVIKAGEAAVTIQAIPEGATEDEKAAIEEANRTKVDAKQMTGYYAELRMLSLLESNKDDVIRSIGQLDVTALNGQSAQQYYDTFVKVKGEFTYGRVSLLNQPWDSEKTFGGIGLLWLIPLISGLTAFASSLLSMHYSKQMTTPTNNGEKQPGQGCTNGMMYMMPLFSLYVSFIVPCGVGIYWIFSNLLALVQTVVLNSIYNPGKIRAQAEAEYQERRRRKAEEKKRLAESRQREQRENALEGKNAQAAGVADKPKEKKLTAAQRNLLEEQAAQAENAAKEAAEERAEDGTASVNEDESTPVDPE